MVVFCLDGLSSGCLLSGWCFVRMVFYQSGLFSEWSFVRVVFYQSGLLSEWSFIRVVFH